MFQFQQDRTSRSDAVPASGQAAPVTAPMEPMTHSAVPDWSREISIPRTAGRSSGVRGTSQLSGGQCQRVAIARAIIGNPEIILADEPTGNLDSKMGAEVMELLHMLNKDDGRTIVMVTHNEDQAKQTTHTVRFFDGRQIG